MNLNGKVAIVTGASRGIGKAIAIELAKNGASVVVAARTQKQPKNIAGTIYQTVEEIKSFRGNAVAVKTKVTNAEMIEKMVQQTIENFNRIDILVNNAATNHPALFKDIAQNLWDTIMDTNLRGLVLCTRAVLPQMIKQKYGHIINISSVVADKTGHKPFTGLAYDVSKAAVNRLTIGLSEELKEYHIAVNALMPDNTDTEGWAYLNPDLDRSEWAKPKTWGKYTAFVAAQAPAAFTGNLLTEDQLKTLMQEQL
jgi:NAD(P)-dependent dehydrogenase (short-subunit alcohol dehydrogenase family)